MLAKKALGLVWGYRMANPNEKYEDNVQGLFYVDRDCIACDTCVGLAGQHFALTDSSDHAFVFKQPSSPQELRVCEEALQTCPVGAIGKESNEWQ